MNQQFWGKYPAIVTHYDPATRLCRVKIPAIAENADVDPEAEIAYPLGDKPKIKDGVVTTEIEILVGDDVWVEFLNGDQNHPIIVNHRCPRIGNDVDWRRWHHANVQVIADDQMLFNAANMVITLSGDLTINATGNVAINSATLKHNGVNVGGTHVHADPQGSNTAVPH
jgi:hypothetical protein